MPAHKIDLSVRFSSKYIETPDGCWLWTANSNGRYGKMKINKKYVGAHKVAYQLYKGDTGDKLVLHTCDNSLCVNPDHLYLGNTSDNQKDRFNRSMRSTNRDKKGRFCGQ